MERIRAALIGCILTGGAIFGARPVLPEDSTVRPVVSSAGAGDRIGLTPAELARWFQPIAANPILMLPIGRPPQTAPTRHAPRRRCNADRLQRRLRL